MKVLFIGNSYTYFNDMPKLLEAIAKGNGQELQTHQVTKGGSFLHAYLDRADEFSEKLVQLSRDNRYDACFLQEQSLCPALDYDRFADGVSRLMAFLAPAVDRFYLYETWTRKEGHPALEANGLTVETLAEKLLNAYEKLGRERMITVSPVGRLFPRMRQADPETELYNEDRTHPSYAGSCLVALQHYKTLFGSVPGDTSMLELPKQTLSLMCKLIMQS